MKLADVYQLRESRDIVVTIPKGKLAEVEAEEADVDRRLSSGETGITYYWAMGRLPKEQPRRIYFCWDGAVRAYHDVMGMGAGRVHMAPQVNPVDPPRPMESFRGYRYYSEDR
jgi:hypothetical protein